MARNELDGGVWTLPASRSKNGRELVLPLSPLAISALERPPRIAGSKFVFTFDGQHAFANFSKAKAQFDKACGVTSWTLHDLRRTARSLMSRAGVSADVAERCLGHVISGVRGTYDRHAYFDEKKRAFEALASLLERIINPPVANVIPLETARK
jgi:integrase